MRAPPQRCGGRAGSLIVLARHIVSALLAIALLVSAPVDFTRDVKPILEGHCIGCHGASKRQGGYRVDRRDLAFGEGDSGVNIVPGKPDASLLYKNVAGIGDSPM